MSLQAISDADLLSVMTARAGDRAQAKAAWEELFLRHRRYLFAVLSRSYGSLLGDDGVADLVIDTLRRAYEWASAQVDADAVRARFAGDSHDAVRRRVLGWLGVIAERQFKERFREGAAKRSEFLQFVIDRSRTTDSATSPASPELDAAIAQLSESEAEALRLSLPWYDPVSSSFAVPRGEAARIAAMLMVTPDTLRQKRHRAIKKIAASLREAGYADSLRRTTS